MHRVFPDHFLRRFSIGRISLRIKMIIGGIIITVIPLVIVGSVIYFYLSSSLEILAKTQTMQVARDMANLMESILKEELKVVSAFSVDPQIIEAVSTGRFEKSILKLTNLVAKIGGDYESITIADRSGIIRSDIHVDRIGINVSDRDYFLKAVEGKASIGRPIFSRATGEPICVIFAPIIDRDHKFVGAVGLILKIDFLMGQVSSVRIGKTAYPFILDDRGMAIIHPLKNYILRHDFTKVNGFESISAMMIRQETGSEKYIEDGVEKIMGFAPIRLIGWSVAVTQDREEVMAPANDILNFILLCGSFFLVLTVSAAYVLGGALGTPVQKRLDILNKAVEQSAEIFVVIGLDRRMNFANPAMENLYGVPMAEFIGKKPVLDNAGHVSPDEIWEILNKGNIWAGVLNVENVNGSVFSIETTITPVRDDRGYISGYLIIGRDITRVLDMEKQLRQSQKMEAIGTLAGGIAHDFNNILSSIVGYAELYKTNRDDILKVDMFIREILNASRRARGLISQILTFSRQTEQEKIPIQPVHLITETMKLLRASLPASISASIDIREVIESESLVMGDPTQLHQVIMNLCTNAAHAMSETGGALEVLLEDVDLDEEFVMVHPGIRPGPHVKLSVRDTGCGISMEDMERIFDPFFTTKPQGQGTGLGLSVVHGIINNMEGIITVKSEVGSGTEFAIYLPVVKETDLTPEDFDLMDRPRGSGRVMVIDDEPNIAVIEREILESLGYAVETFSDSTAALDAFRERPDHFDVIITDYTMPGMPGLELVRKMKKIKGDIPIILCSSRFDILTDSMASELGIGYLLKKPVLSHELASCVSSVLEKSKP